jgi:capsular polysaccharide biosynthesis protein
MENTEKENKRLEQQPGMTILLFVLQWWKHLAAVSFSAALISIVAAFLIRPQYKSTTGIFAVKSFSTSKYLTEGPQSIKEDYMDIGDEDDIEKLLQILNSSELQELVVKRFDLFRHWNINPSDKNKQTWMNLKFMEMVAYKRTDMLSIKIEVHDYSPDTAALIANSIAEFADTVKTRFSKRIAYEALNILVDEYGKTVNFMKQLEDSMQVLRSKGVLDYNLQVEAYTRSLGKALAGGNNSGISRIEEKMKALEKFGGAYLSLTNEFILQKERQVFLKAKLDEAYLNASKTLPSNMVVQKATSSDKHSRPIRWLIVFVSTISAFLISLMFLIVFEKIKQLKKKMS